MRSKNSFILYSLMGMVGGIIVAVLALMFTGAGHSPHVEFWIGLFKLGLFVVAISAIAFIIAIIVRASSAVSHMGKTSSIMPEDDLEQLLKNQVHGFIRDNYEWKRFVQAHYDFETGAGQPEVQAKWEALLDTYCAPGKRGRDGASMTNTIHHLPEEEHIVDYTLEDDTATVFTQVRWTKGYRKGEVEPYEIEFKATDGKWFLDQVYLLALRGRFECL